MQKRVGTENCIMYKELFALSERIKMLRIESGFTQAELAKRCGLSRSAVNGWEVGISVPSPRYIIELAKTFNVSTDYLLGMDKGAAIYVDGISEKNVAVLSYLAETLKEKDNG